MKNYSCRSFDNTNTLLNFLNENQDANVISILDCGLVYRVFYYIEENISGGHRGMG